MTLSAPYNDLEALEAMADRSGSTWAAIIVEPVAGNMGVVAPDPGFLPGLRTLCDRTGALLVFDEVMTGFRLGLGGAQERYGVTPDLTCLGKIVGGGLPLAAVGGRAAIMDQLAPLGPVYQAGTLSGNPLATAAGLATLQELDPGVYARLEALGAQLASGLEAVLADAGVEGTVPRVGSMWSISFRPTAPRNLDEVKAADAERFARFFHGMLAQGIYLAPSPFEAMFLSAAHGEEAIAATVAAARRVLSSP
jgi:glutamate-1-semialdehyde 2,1-aminomutase (EC 5.4.3.8)